VAWNAAQQTTTNARDTQKNSSVLSLTLRIIAFVIIRFTDTISPAAPEQRQTTLKCYRRLSTRLAPINYIHKADESSFFDTVRCNDYRMQKINKQLQKQGLALTGRNTTGPPSRAATW